MKYLMILINDWQPAADVEEELIGDSIGPYVESISDWHLAGHPLQDPSTATCVRVRDGEVLLTDGPFIEGKEGIAGFSLLDCDSVDQAVQVAAGHPLTWFFPTELRPIRMDDAPAPLSEDVLRRLEAGPEAGHDRYMLLVYSDGVSTPEKRETMRQEIPRLIEAVTTSGALVFGAPLERPEAARTVRVRGPHTLVTDGPAMVAPEFFAGFDIVDCASRQEAIDIAASHPVAKFHAVEVRPFTPRPCGETDEQVDHEHQEGVLSR